MRIANVRGRLTTFVDGEAVDIAERSNGQFGPDPMSAFADWNALAAWGASIGAIGGGEIDQTTLGAPVPTPTQVFAIGMNYLAHANEGPFGPPPAPAVFTKFPGCIVGADHVTAIPAETTDYEVELVLAIGREASHVAQADAWSYVAGLMIGQDFSERTMQRAGNAPQFSLAKSYTGFGPTGPWLVTLDEFSNPDDLRLSTTIGGEILQDSRTSDLIFDVPYLIEYLSAVLPLQVGDLIFTGTPSGVGSARTPPRWLRSGETVVSAVEDIGELHSRLV